MKLLTVKCQVPLQTYIIRISTHVIYVCNQVSLKQQIFVKCNILKQYKMEISSSYQYIFLRENS